jgi:hypothetical protein
MKKILLFQLIIVQTVHVNANNPDSLVIQENSSGICTMDGVVETDAAGYKKCIFFYYCLMVQFS